MKKRELEVLTRNPKKRTHLIKIYDLQAYDEDEKPEKVTASVSIYSPGATSDDLKKKVLVGGVYT